MGTLLKNLAFRTKQFSNVSSKKLSSMSKEEQRSELSAILVSRRTIEESAGNEIQKEENEEQSEKENSSESESEGEQTKLNLPFREGPFEFAELIEILDILQNGFENKTSTHMVKLFTNNGVWKYHPHDPTRSYEGRSSIQRMLNDEFVRSKRFAMQYLPDQILFDPIRESAYVEWILKSQRANADGFRIKQITCGVRMVFQDNRIAELRSYPMKTIDFWTKDITDERFRAFEPEVIEHGPTEVYASRSKNTTSSSSSSSTRMKKKRKGPHRSTTDGSSGRRDRRYNRKKGRNGAYHRHKNQNGRRNGSRNGNGLQIVRTKYDNNNLISWICSVCQERNKGEKRNCRRCQKNYQSGKDLTEKERKQLLGSLEERNETEEKNAQQNKEEETTEFVEENST